jgi:hypothetical protein
MIMLQNLENFYGKKLAASDGEIGHVKDFYFDDAAWAIHRSVATKQKSIEDPSRWSGPPPSTRIPLMLAVRDQVMLEIPL